MKTRSAVPVLSILLAIFVFLDIYLYASYSNYEKQTKILTKELNNLLKTERKEAQKQIEDIKNENKLKEESIRKLKLELKELNAKKQKVVVKYLKDKDKIQNLNEKGITNYWKNEFNEE